MKEKESKNGLDWEDKSYGTTTETTTSHPYKHIVNPHPQQVIFQWCTQHLMACLLQSADQGDDFMVSSMHIIW